MSDYKALDGNAVDEVDEVDEESNSKKSESGGGIVSLYEEEKETKDEKITLSVNRQHGLKLIVPRNWGPMHIYDKYDDKNINGIVVAATMNFPSCIGDYKLIQGKWYYEIKIIIPKSARFGWGLHSQHNSSYNHRGTGSDSDGWSFDPETAQKYHGKIIQQRSNIINTNYMNDEDEDNEDDEYDEYMTDQEDETGMKYGTKWKVNDIIGCSIDIDHKTMHFYLNGVCLGIAFEDFEIKDGISPSMSCEKGGEFIVITDENKLSHIPDGGYKPLPSKNLNKENIVKLPKSNKFRGKWCDEKYNDSSSQYDHSTIFVGIRLKAPFFEQFENVEVFVDDDKQIMIDPLREYHNDEIFGRSECQILYETKYDLPQSIKFKIDDKDWCQEIKYDEINWTQNTSNQDDIECVDISQRKWYETDEYEIYEESIKIWRSFCFPDESQCAILIDPKSKIDDFKEIEMKADDDYFGSDVQVFYDKKHNIVYGISNETVLKSKVFDGANKVNTNWFCLYEIEQNITWNWMICCRHNWIKNVCLYGQDNEFNIFRSMCFVPPSTEDEMSSRIAMGILTLLLQIILTVSIVYEVFNNWDTDIMFDSDAIIITISFMVFAFISFMYSFTAEKYWQFYQNMHEIIIIPAFIQFLDFCSNILIGFVICLVALFYLLQSETTSDAVLNSFALTFVIELDDMANLYEADEDALISADFAHLKYSDFEHRIKKRKIEINSKEMICWVIFMLLLSPFRILLACYKTFAGIAFSIKYKNRKQFENKYDSHATPDEVCSWCGFNF